MPFIGEISALVTALLWSFTSVVFSEASFRVGSLIVNITRLIFASVYLIITIAVIGADINLSSQQLFYLSLSGLIGLVFGDGFLFKAFQEIGPRLSMLIMSLAPPISFLLAYFFLGEVLSFWGIAGIFITIGGVAIVILQKQRIVNGKFSVSRAGIIYGFFGAIGQAVGLILAKLAFNEGEINSFVATFVRIFASIIVFLPLIYFSKRLKNPVQTFSKDRKALGFTLLGSVIGPYLGITGSLIAIANTYVGIAATLMATVPIMMLPISKYIYKEELSWKSVAGAFIAVGGVAILFLK